LAIRPELELNGNKIEELTLGLARLVEVRERSLRGRQLPLRVGGELRGRQHTMRKDENYMIHLRKTTGLSLGISITMAACGQDAEISTEAASANSTIERASNEPAEPSVDVDEPAEPSVDVESIRDDFVNIDTTGSGFEIAEQLSPCEETVFPGMIVDLVPIVPLLNSATNWLILEAIEPAVFGAPSRVTSTYFGDSSPGPEIVQIDPSFVRAATWAFGEDGALVYLPIFDEGVEMPVAITLFISLPGKGVFAAGQCQNDHINLRFVDMFGGDAVSILDDLPGKIGTDLARHLRIVERVEQTGPTS